MSLDIFVFAISLISAFRAKGVLAGNPSTEFVTVFISNAKLLDTTFDDGYALEIFSRQFEISQHVVKRNTPIISFPSALQTEFPRRHSDPLIKRCIPSALAYLEES